MSSILRRFLKSISKSGSAKITGDATLSEGANITLTQSGNNIEIAASGGGGGGTVDSVVAGNNIDVDATDPANPIVSVETLTAADISDFDTEVSNNTDVAANTSARHAAVTVTDSGEIDFTLTGQDITASLKAGSIDETKLDTSVNTSLDLADSAVQPGDLATVATTGDYDDLTNKPTIPTVSDTAYDATSWNGNTDAPTKNAVRDKIDTMDTAISLNTAKVTNATHTGEVTGSGALTIADDVVDEANLKVDNSPTDDYYLAAKSSAAGGLTWKALPSAGSGDVVGPASSTDNAIARFDGTTGKLLQDTSNVTISDGGTITTESLVVNQDFQTDRVIINTLSSLSDGSDIADVSPNSLDIRSGVSLKTNTINETTAGSGVTIDGVLIKDTTVDVNGTADALILDADGDTTISAPTDDQIDFEVGGTDRATLNGGGLTVIGASPGTGGITTGSDGLFTNVVSERTASAGVTVDGVLIKDGAIAKSVVGLGNVDNTSDATKNSATATLTNKDLSSSTNTFPATSNLGIISGATLGTTGNKSVTGIGFTPSVVRFEVIMVQSTGSTAFGNGAMSSSTQFYTAGTVNTAVSNDNVRIGSETNCIGWIASGGTTASLLASYVSMDADGFTINVSVANSAFAVAWIAYR